MFACSSFSHHPELRGLSHRQDINHINNINMASIMEKAIYRIKMRTDNTILMIIMGDGIMGDLHFCLYVFLFFPQFSYKQYVLFLQSEINKCDFQVRFLKNKIPPVFPLWPPGPSKQLGGLTWGLALPGQAH